MKNFCQVTVYVELPCPARESGGLQCERVEPHEEDRHWLSEHTIRHSLIGNGYACNTKQ